MMGLTPDRGVNHISECDADTDVPIGRVVKTIPRDQTGHSGIDCSLH